MQRVAANRLVLWYYKQVDVLPSKNQALCDFIYNVLYISNNY